DSRRGFIDCADVHIYSCFRPSGAGRPAGSSFSRGCEAQSGNERRPMTMQLPASLKKVPAAEEQAWNREKLAARVWEPDFRLWAYQEPAVVLGCSAGSNIEIDRCSDL